jgi:hypothetical protein
VSGASTAAAEASFAMEREAVALRRLALATIICSGWGCGKVGGERCLRRGEFL